MKTVLIVEDHQGLRELLAEAVRGWGYLAETAEDFFQSIWGVSEFYTDAVITDLHYPPMPHKPIHPCGTVLADTCNLLDIPCLIVSGDPPDGVHRWIQKPYRLEDIQAWLKEVLL